MPKKACPCRTSSKAAAIPAPTPPVGSQANLTTRPLYLPAGFVAGAARGLLKALEAHDPTVLQLAGLPILELGRRVAAGEELEKRLQGLEARIKHLENKSEKV